MVDLGGVGHSPGEAAGHSPDIAGLVEEVVHMALVVHLVLEGVVGRLKPRRACLPYPSDWSSSLADNNTAGYKGSCPAGGNTAGYKGSSTTACIITCLVF